MVKNPRVREIVEPGSSMSGRVAAPAVNTAPASRPAPVTCSTGATAVKARAPLSAWSLPSMSAFPSLGGYVARFPVMVPQPPPPQMAPRRVIDRIGDKAERAVHDGEPLTEISDRVGGVGPAVLDRGGGGQQAAGDRLEPGGEDALEGRVGPGRSRARSSWLRA